MYNKCITISAPHLLLIIIINNNNINDNNINNNNIMMGSNAFDRRQKKLYMTAANE